MKPDPPEPDPGSQDWMREARDLKSALDEHAIVAMTDRQGRITFVNDKCCAISKYSREGLLGQDHRILNSGHHPPEFFAGMWGDILQGRVWHGDVRNRAQDGTFYWIGMTIVPFLDGEGEPRQFAAIGTHISEQKRVEAELGEKLRLQRLLADLSSRFVALQAGEVNAVVVEAQRLIVETLGIDRSGLWQRTGERGDVILTSAWERPVWPAIPPGFEARESLPWSYDRVMSGESVCFASVAELP